MPLVGDAGSAEIEAMDPINLQPVSLESLESLAWCRDGIPTQLFALSIFWIDSAGRKHNLIIGTPEKDVTNNLLTSLKNSISHLVPSIPISLGNLESVVAADGSERQRCCSRSIYLIAAGQLQCKGGSEEVSTPHPQSDSKAPVWNSGLSRSVAVIVPVSAANCLGEESDEEMLFEC